MINKLRFLFLLGILLLSSCGQDEEFEITDKVSLEDDFSNIRMCTELYVDTDEFISTRGTVIQRSKWKPGETIKVKFLNGDSFLQGKVRKYIAQWQIFANIKVQYVAYSQNADIKIAFRWNGDGDSWSYVGKDCQYIAQNRPSMNFGWLNRKTSEQEFRRVILHEFGHALGMIHEHQHPLNNISWNKARTYEYYKKEQGWSHADVDRNIFKKYSTTQTNNSKYDRLSIMHYSINKNLTTNGYSVGWNTVLSWTDKSFIGNIYPFAANTTGFYRYYFNGKHFYTSNFYELGFAHFEENMGRIYRSRVIGTMPIYRYYNVANGDRLSTLNYNELKGGSGNWRYEGISGYAYNKHQANTIPVYRYYKSGHHFLTINSKEVAGGKFGFRSEGIAFYILRN